MPLSGTLSKAHIIDAVIEQNGYTRKKSIETVEILLALIKQYLESGPLLKSICFLMFLQNYDLEF